MVRDTNARHIQDKITGIDRTNSDDGSYWKTTEWGELAANEQLKNDAWAHIGKELTYRLFSKVHYEENLYR